MGKETPRFEDALASLEEIVSKLESDELSLDKALDYFEKGVKLMRSCDEHLKGAEGKLKELLKGEHGEYIEKVLGVDLTSVLGDQEFHV